MPVVSEAPERKSRRPAAALLVTLFFVLLTVAVWTPLAHHVDVSGKRAALIGYWCSDAEFASRVGPAFASTVAAPGLQFHRHRAAGRTVWFFHLRLGHLRWLGGWVST